MFKKLNIKIKLVIVSVLILLGLGVSIALVSVESLQNSQIENSKKQLSSLESQKYIEVTSFYILSNHSFSLCQDNMRHKKHLWHWIKVFIISQKR